MKKEPENFIAKIVEEDLTEGYQIGELKFRFPPEPNEYLHIGHAKSIFINFVREVQSGEHLQFLRTGYFVADKESRTDNLIFNRTVNLREGSGYQEKN